MTERRRGSRRGPAPGDREGSEPRGRPGPRDVRPAPPGGLPAGKAAPPAPASRGPIDAGARLAAARDFERNLVVTAGAGTGKTSLLVERMLHQILERGVEIDRMAAITFTVKAAAELRDRLEDSLERAASVAAGESAPDIRRHEADRVLDRLDPSTHEAALGRALRALERLDAAPIGTLHGFAADLLRRHHRKSGVDVAFEVDEGGGALDLFDQEWARYLEETLGSRGEPPGWKDLLEKAPMDAAEDLARRLVDFRFPLEALGPGGEEAQCVHARVRAESCLAGAKDVRRGIQGGSKVNKNLPGVLDALEAFFGEVATSGHPERAAKPELPRSCSLGKNADVPEKERLQGLVDRLLSEAGVLSGTDAGIAGSLGLALEPFVRRFREAYLRRGLLSYEGIILRARDLLKDHGDVRRAEAARLDHILVDEFQDTDPAQYEIVFFLSEAQDPGGGSPPSLERDAYRCRLSPGKLFIVGDAKQSIYHFRGADIRGYARAVEALEREGARVLTLSANFRSVPELIDPLNDLFAAQFPAPGEAADGLDPERAPLVAERPAAGGPAIEVWTLADGPVRASDRRAEEARAVASWIQEGLERGAHRARDIAILLASFSEVDTLLRALRLRGIRYIVDGGKGFFRRFEVELLLAFLRALLSPADSVSLVACLRSPACAVPDAELQLHALESARSRTPMWSLDACPDAGRLPNFSRALALLREIRDRHRGEPIDRLACAVLDETPLRLAMAASYEGAQRVANLEKAVRHIAEVAQDWRLTGAEILDRIEAEDSTEVEEGDSPLADEMVDAVRILSIHKAKGLEWPTVIVPDLARDLRGPRSGETVALVEDVSTPPAGGAQREPLPAALAIEVGGIRTPALLRHRDDEERQRESESKRLLYVALTRAREKLILVAGAPQKGRRTWVDALRAWGQEPGGAGAGAGDSLHGGAVRHVRIPPGESARAEARDEAPDESLVRAARAFRELRLGLAGQREEGLRSPSSLVDGAELQDRLEVAADSAPLSAAAGSSPLATAAVGGGAPEGGGAAGSDRLLGMAAGTAVHLLLELWDRKDPGWLLRSAPLAARVAARSAGLDADRVAEKVGAILRRASRTGSIEALRSLPVLGREVPLVFRDSQGRIWEGTMDLVAGSIESPRVVDFKTAPEGADPAALERAYAGQLGVYAEALRRALDLDGLPPAAIHVL